LRLVLFFILHDCCHCHGPTAQCVTALDGVDGLWLPNFCYPTQLKSGSQSAAACSTVQCALLCRTCRPFFPDLSIEWIRILFCDPFRVSGVPNRKSVCFTHGATLRRSTAYRPPTQKDVSRFI
jgi:hypothetical protein